MARRTKQQKQKEKKIVKLLVTVIAAAILMTVLAVVPDSEIWLQEMLGITRRAAPPGAVESDVSIHIVDVGQGDAALIEASGEFALIDAGIPENEDVLVSYLRSAGVEKLRYVFMTHPHADHIGGMQAVIEIFEVEQMVLPDFSLAPYPTTKLFENLLESMVEQKIPTKTAQMGQRYPLGSGQVEVVHAGTDADEDYNLMSLGLLFTGGGMSFLNTGDAEKVNERIMLESGADLGALVFLAGHHGSSTSNSQKFIEAVAPQYVVVSCGAENRYGHPHKEPMETFENVGATVLRTDEHGHVRIFADENGDLVYATQKTP